MRGACGACALGWALLALGHDARATPVPVDGGHGEMAHRGSLREEALRGARVGTPLLVDRVVVRFDAPETGGVAHPRYVLERELAFEARLEALSDGESSAPYLDRHVRAALERHIAEDLLAHLGIDPEPSDKELATRFAVTRAVLAQRVGGATALAEAARAEGLDRGELDSFVQREARASLYLDRMVAPMLEPSEAELREVHRSTSHPFRGQRFEQAESALRAWYVGERLSSALGAFYQNARSRVHVVLVGQK